MSCTLCHFPHQLVILIGADEEGGSEGIEAAFSRLTGGVEKAHLIALDAATADVFRNLPDEGPQAVIVPLDEGQFDFLGVLPDAVAAGAVLGEGMDIGVVPVAGNLEAVGAEHIDGLVGTGGTTNMKQGFHGKTSKNSKGLL